MKKLNLTDLNVQSFITINKEEVLKTAKGGTDPLDTRPRFLCENETRIVVICQRSNTDCSQPPQCYTTC